MIKHLFNVVSKNFHVYIVGFLFGIGLGFDTATQIAVLATSATAANKGVPWVAILSFQIGKYYALEKSKLIINLYKS